MSSSNVQPDRLLPPSTQEFGYSQHRNRLVAVEEPPPVADVPLGAAASPGRHDDGSSLLGR